MAKCKIVVCSKLLHCFVKSDLNTVQRMEISRKFIPSFMEENVKDLASEAAAAAAAAEGEKVS